MFFRPKGSNGKNDDPFSAAGLQAWTDAIKAWQHAQAEAARAAMLHQKRMADAMMLQANPQETMQEAARDAAQVVEAWTEAWRSTLDGWQGEFRPTPKNWEANPFGLTGWFVTDAAHHKSAKPAAKAASAGAAPEKKPASPAPVSRPVAEHKTPVKAPPAADAKVAHASAPAKRAGTVAEKTPAAKSPAVTAKKEKPSEDAGKSKPKAKAAGKAKAKSKDIKPDDLTLISGIGPKLATVLHEAGIKQYRQLADLSEKQAETMDEALNLQGRVVREAWVRQAQQLLKDRP